MKRSIGMGIAAAAIGVLAAYPHSSAAAEGAPYFLACSGAAGGVPQVFEIDQAANKVLMWIPGRHALRDFCAVAQEQPGFACKVSITSAAIHFYVGNPSAFSDEYTIHMLDGEWRQVRRIQGMSPVTIEGTCKVAADPRS